MPVSYAHKGGNWPWVLTEPYTFHLITPADGVYHCKHQTMLCAKVNRNYITLQPGYAIDGATGGITFKSFMPSFFEHDVICQFYHNLRFRRHIADRPEGDKMFLRTMRLYGKWPERALIPLYYRAVQIYGATRPPTHDPNLRVYKI